MSEIQKIKKRLLEERKEKHRWRLRALKAEHEREKLREMCALKHTVIDDMRAEIQGFKYGR